MALVDLKSDLAKNAGKNLSKISGRLNNSSLSDKQGKSLSTQLQFENKSKNKKLSNLDLDKTQKIYFKDGSFISDIERRQTKGEIHVGWPHTVNWPGLESYYKKALSDKDQLGMRRIGAQGNSMDQPYIIRPIGKRWFGGKQIGNTVDFIRGGAGTFASRVAQDILRLGKFSTTGRGLIFIGKQFLFQAFNPRSESAIYNPLSLLSKGPLHISRNLLDFPMSPSGNYENVISNAIQNNPLFRIAEAAKKATDLAKRWSKFDFTGKDDKEAYEESVKLKQRIGYYRVKAIGNQGRVQDPKWSDVLGGPIKGGRDTGNVDQLNMHPYGGLLSDRKVNDNDSDFISFKFRDVVNGKWIIFRALLSGISDTVTPEWHPERYVGRPDNVYVYQGVTREVAFNFAVYPKTRQELPVLWDKLNYLVGLCYPSWYNNSPGMSMVPPMIELTIGDMFKNTPGFLSTLTLTVEDGSTWEIDKGLQLPKHITCGCSFTYIGKHLPSTVGKHFELNWLSNPKGDGLGTFMKYSDGSSVAEQPGPNRGPYEPTIFPSNRPKRPAVPLSTLPPEEPEELTPDD